MKPCLLNGITTAATFTFPCSSDPSLKLFAEETNQRQVDSFCSSMKPHLHHYCCFTHFPKLLTDFHWFQCSRFHSSDTSLISLRYLWCNKKQFISCTTMYGISSALSFSSLFPRHNPLSASNFCNMRIRILSVTLSSLDCISCILLCNSTRWF